MKLPALDVGPHRGCLNCAPRPRTLRLTDIVAVGFGDAHCERDGEIVYEVWRDGSETPSSRRNATVRRFEMMARHAPRHDWRIVLDGPLHGETYQRHGKNRWVLVKRNTGFA